MAEDGNHDEPHAGDEEFKKFLASQPGPLSVPQFVVRTNNEKIDRLTALLKLSVDGIKALPPGDAASPNRGFDAQTKEALLAFSKELMDELMKSFNMYGLVQIRELDGDSEDDDAA